MAPYPKLASIDPGYSKKGASGWGAYVSGELVFAGGVRREPDWSPGRMGAEVGSRIVTTVSDPIELVVVERMKSYSHANQKGDQNDLIHLAEVGGVAAGIIAGVRLVDDGLVADIEHIDPFAWKGNVPGDIFIERIKDALKPHELRVAEAAIARDLGRAKSLAHNIWDGIGLGLHRLGRLRR